MRKFAEFLHSVRVWSAITIAAMTTSCGGGGTSSSSPVAPSTNQPPNFTSAAAASVIENTATAFYTAAATDPEGSAVTFSISGGVDAASFTLSGSQLLFSLSPNFDLPTDADANNVYLVQIRASDGQSSTTLDLQITVTNSREGIAVRRIATGFVDPVSITSIPGDSKLFVIERGGAIYTFDPSNGQKTLFQTLSLSTDGERGLRALAVAPDYATSGRYFVLFSTSTGDIVISGCRRSGTFGSPICNDGVAGVPHGPTNNYGAFMGFGPDNKLYVATGDGGGSGDPAGSAQGTSILGKLLRIDNNPDPFAGAAPSYFIATQLSKGFRNPRGGSFFNGQLLIADRGETTKDEINLTNLASGSNFGWPFKEGTTALGASTPSGLTDPVIDYPRIAGGGVVGGFVYRGQIVTLRNHYIFGDSSGTIFSLPASQIASGQTLTSRAIEKRTTDFVPDVGVLNSPVAFGEDQNGELYILDADGEIFVVLNS